MPFLTPARFLHWEATAFSVCVSTIRTLPSPSSMNISPPIRIHIAQRFIPQNGRGTQPVERFLTGNKTILFPVLYSHS